MSQSNKNSSGNVLFLILIAVALFAALSYAVTSSTRSGGGDAERERIQLDAASALNHLTAISTAALRRSIDGEELVLTNNVGGIHEPGVGIPIIHPNLSLYDPIGGIVENEFSWEFYQDALFIGGQHLGTSDQDYYVNLCGFSSPACEAINKEFKGNTTIETVTFGAVQPYRYSAIRRDGTVVDSNLSAQASILPTNSSGCYNLSFNPNRNCVFLIVQER